MNADLFLAIGIALILSFGVLTALHENSVPSKITIEKQILAKMHDTP